MISIESQPKKVVVVVVFVVVVFFVIVVVFSCRATLYLTLSVCLCVQEYSRIFEERYITN